MFPDYKNILVIRTDRIGDLILSLPLAQIIKKNYPKSRVTFLVREYPSALLNSNKFIDNALLLKEEENKSLFFDNLKMIRKENFDTVIVLNARFQTALITALARIKYRVGTGYRWYSFLFNKKVFEHRKYGKRHELEYNVRFLQQIGIEEKIKPGEVTFPLEVNDEIKKRVRENLEVMGLNDDYIIIHPGSGGSATDLPVSKYKELAGLLVKEGNKKVLLTGGQGEYELCSFIAQEDPRIVNMAGKFNLEELIAVIAGSELFISNSTGPLHIAAALQKWVIGFYPNKKDCSSTRWGPYTERAKIFTPKKNECIECTKEQCGSKECMNNIKVTEVFVEIQKIYTFLINNGEINVKKG
jgi:heptosyltransferase III